jgi:hypothetical protein
MKSLEQVVLEYISVQLDNNNLSKSDYLFYTEIANKILFLYLDD